jgi:hypothetical protein
MPVQSQFRGDFSHLSRSHAPHETNAGRVYCTPGWQSGSKTCLLTASG